MKNNNSVRHSPIHHAGTIMLYLSHHVIYDTFTYIDGLCIALFEGNLISTVHSKQ